MFSLPPIKEPKSYMKGTILSYKVREFDPTEHEIIHSGRTHDRYNCPFCLDVRGKEDTDGKLYWSRDKFISFCFKCETTGILKTDRNISEVRLEVALASMMTQLVSRTSEDVILSEIPYNKMFDPINDEGKQYLESRVPIYSELFNKLNFRVTPEVGLAVPCIIDNKIVSYSLRFYNPTGKMKYYIPVGQKYVYSPNNIINSDNRYVELTIVEGYFDAIGAMLDGHKNPVAIFGKSMTPVQVAILRKLSPVKINIYLDEAKLSWDVLRKIRNHFPTCSEFCVVPTNYDPEEKLVFRMNRVSSEDDMKLLFNDIQGALDKLPDNVVNTM